MKLSYVKRDWTEVQVDSFYTLLALEYWHDKSKRNRVLVSNQQNLLASFRGLEGPNMDPDAISQHTPTASKAPAEETKNEENYSPEMCSMLF